MPLKRNWRLKRTLPVSFSIVLVWSILFDCALVAGSFGWHSCRCWPPMWLRNSKNWRPSLRMSSWIVQTCSLFQCMILLYFTYHCIRRYLWLQASIHHIMSLSNFWGRISATTRLRIGKSALWMRRERILRNPGTLAVAQSDLKQIFCWG